jgi:hypothetical protein
MTLKKRRTLWVLVCPLLVMAGQRSAGATVVWRSTFEAGDTKEWNGGLNTTKGARSNIDVVMDPVQEGKSSCRIVIHPDDTFQPYNQSRVELHHSSTLTAEGKDTYLSGYYRMAMDAQVRNEIGYWESNGSSQNVMDFWIEPKAGGGTTLAFGTGFLGAKRVWSTDFSLNTWHQLAIHVHWSVNATMGSVDVWYDGAQVVKDEKAKTKADANTLFYQTGFHRRSPQPFTETIFLDNFVEADTLDEVLGMPAPGGADGGVPPSDAGGSGDAPVSGSDGGSDSGGGAGGGGAGGAPGSGGITGSGSGGVSGTGGGAPGGSGGTAGAGTLTGASSGGCALAGRCNPASLMPAGVLLAACLLRSRRSARRRQAR